MSSIADELEDRVTTLEAQVADLESSLEDMTQERDTLRVERDVLVERVSNAKGALNEVVRDLGRE